MTMIQLQQSDPTPQHIIAALDSAQNSSEAIKNLYMSFKKANPRYSIPYLCKKAGITSQGYLSDVMHGKRRLNAKYVAGIIRTFGLKGAAARYFKALIDIDHQKDDTRAEALGKRLPALKKSMTIQHHSIGLDMAQFFLALEIFCAFGLFQNRPTLQNLVDYFVSRSPSEVHRAILMLKELKLIEASSDGYIVSNAQINFSGERFSQIDYLKMAFKNGIQSMEKWYDQPDCSLFESINISVKKTDLKDYLPRIRQNTEDLRLGLETENGDMVVRFNLQIYPIQ